jgi:hypothetical protein
MQTYEALIAPPAVPAISAAAENSTIAAPSVAPPAKASSTEVLISEQEVMFGTAVAAPSRRQNRLVAILSRLFATSTAESRPWPTQPRRMYYIERGRMGREMERL